MMPSDSRLGNSVDVDGDDDDEEEDEEEEDVESVEVAGGPNIVCVFPEPV